MIRAPIASSEELRSLDKEDEGELAFPSFALGSVSAGVGVLAEAAEGVAFAA